MNIEELKTICTAHAKCIEKIELIEHANKERWWLKVENPKNEEFYLSDNEIGALLKHLKSKKMELEKVINEILNK